MYIHIHRERETDTHKQRQTETVMYSLMLLLLECYCKLSMQLANPINRNQANPNKLPKWEEGRGAVLARSVETLKLPTQHNNQNIKTVRKH